MTQTTIVVACHDLPPVYEMRDLHQKRKRQLPPFSHQILSTIVRETCRKFALATPLLRPRTPSSGERKCIAMWQLLIRQSNGQILSNSQLWAKTGQSLSNKRGWIGNIDIFGCLCKFGLSDFKMADLKN